MTHKQLPFLASKICNKLYTKNTGVVASWLAIRTQRALKRLKIMKNLTLGSINLSPRY